MLRALNVAALIGVFGFLIYEYAVPIAAGQYLGERYKTLMFSCDHAMRDHYIAKKSVELNPTDLSIKNLEATELGLMSCHDYDKIRKKMEALNVSENKLSRLGLEALEEREYDLQRFVKTHEFRY